MTSKTPIPPCPQCGTNKQAVPQGELFWCKRCSGLYDDQPNEGSDVFADPSRRMELAERKRGRK